MAGNIFGGILCIDYYIYEKASALNGNSGFNQFIINFINEGLYFYTFVDLYYIPNTFFYKKTHYLHDIQVLGYDLHSECYYSMHFSDKGYLSVFKVSFTDFFNAYVNSPGVLIMHDLVITFKKNNVKPEANTNFIKDEIKVFLNSDALERRNQVYFSGESNIHYENSHIHEKLQSFAKDYFKPNDKPNDMWTWGVSTYTEIIKYYQGTLNCKKNYDIRPLNLLFEHKKMMISRIKYLQNIIKTPELDRVLKNYLELEKLSLIARNSIIKYNIRSNGDIIKKVNDYLHKIAEIECHSLERLHASM